MFLSMVEFVAQYNLRKTFILIMSGIGCITSFAQPTTDFTVDSPVCLGQNLGIQNNSIDATRYEWDFCIGDFEVEPVINSQAMSGLNFGSGFELIEDNGLWYAFVVDRGSGTEVFRYDYGDSPLNDPVVTQLELTPGIFISPPEDISVINYNNQWHAVIAYSNSGGEVIRLDFGSELSNNSPIEVNLGNFGFADAIRYVQLIEESGNLILVLSPNTGTSLWRISYGDSFDNPIDIGTDIIKTSAPEADLTRLMGFDVKIINEDYIVHCVTVNAAKIMRLNFGNSLLNTPIWEATYDFAGPTNSYDIELIREGSNYYGYVTNPSSSPLVFDFGDLSSPVQPIQKTYTTTLPTNVALDLLRYEGQTYALGVNSKNYIRSVYYYDCSASQQIAIDENPNVYYDEPGDYMIALTAYDNNDNQA